MTFIFIIAIVVIFVCILLYTRKFKTTEGFGMFYDETKKFTDSQNDSFHDSVGKALFINDGIGLKFLNDAVQQPELYLPKSPDRKYDNYFQYNPENMYNVDDSLCRKATHPKDLPPRKSHSKVGCGWYFIPEPSVNSVGTIGRVTGPIFPDKVTPIGEWIWDLNIAAQKEDIKFCKKYKNCQALHIDEVRQKCAFCPSEGHAIPIKSNGDQKYPDSSDGSCGQELFRTPQDCDKPPAPEPITASNGISCGTLGYPSPDNAERFYKKSECDALGGVDLGNDGRCYVKTGGSYSWDCRGLNQPASLTAPTKGICTPNAKGELSKECIVSLATSIGYSKAGGFMKIWGGTGQMKPNELSQLWGAVADPDLTGYLGFNVLLFTTEYAESSETNIAKLMSIKNMNASPAGVPLLLKRLNMVFAGMSNPSRKISGYSKWLAMGDELPDLCDKTPNEMGPFEVACLQQAFRKSGCQASGEGYPNDPNMYRNKKWSDVNTEFRNLYDSMKSPDPKLQDDAVRKCLGIKYYRPNPDPNYLGCFRDSNDRTLTDITIVGRAAPGKSIKPICEKLAISKGHKFYGLQNGEACCSGNDPNFARHGEVEECADDGGHYTQQIYKTNIPDKEYNYVGCFKDNGARMIPNWNKPGQAMSVEQCKQEARNKGHDTFGVQYGGQCFSGQNPKYDALGPETNTGNCGPLGGSWSNQVYKTDFIKGYKRLPKTDRGGADIGCFPGQKASFCKEKCDSDPNCKSFNDIMPIPGGGMWKNGGCCYKRESGPTAPHSYVDLYVKEDNDYEFTQGMDSGGNDITHTQGSPDQLKAWCNANPSCKGFNTNGWMKHTISPQSAWYRWTNAPASGMYVKKGGAGASGGITACGVNSSDSIYCNSTVSGSNPTGEWKQLPGSLKHISVNKGKVFGVNSGEAIYGADDSNNPQWVNLPGHLKQISVSDNVVCGANRFDDIYCADNNNKQNPNWFQVPGKLKHVTVNKGKLYGANSNDDIYAADNYKNAQWTQVPGKLKQVSFDDNVVCGVNSGDEIYCADNGSKQNPNWQRLPGSLKYVSVKNKKLVGTNSGDQIWFADSYKSPNWKQIPGALKQVEIG